MCPGTYARVHRQQRAPRRLPALFATLFLHFIPSIFFGIIALFLDEVASLINRAAELCHGPSPPSSRSSSSRKLIRHSSQSPSVSFDATIQGMVFNHQLEPQSPFEPKSFIEPKSSREPLSANEFLLPATEASLACFQQFAKSKSTPPSHWENFSEFEASCKTPIIPADEFAPESSSNHLDTKAYIYNSSTFVSSVTTHSSTSSISSKPTSFVKASISKVLPTIESENYLQYDAHASFRDPLPSRGSYELTNIHESPSCLDEEPALVSCSPTQSRTEHPGIPQLSPSQTHHEAHGNSLTLSIHEDKSKLSMENEKNIMAEVTGEKIGTDDRPHHDDTGTSHSIARKLPGKLVEQRVNAFENVIGEDVDDISELKVPMPSTPLLPPVSTEELRLNTASTPPSLKRGSTALFSEHSGYSSDDELDTRIELKKRTPNSGEVDELVGISVDISLTDTDAAEDDAPTGVESLKELMPVVNQSQNGTEKKITLSTEVRPESSKIVLSHSSERSGLSLDDCIAEVDSMEKIPSLRLQTCRSYMSAHTESYSSPDSPSTTALGPTRPATTWMKHEDLFAEEPSIPFDGALEDKSSLRLDEFPILSLGTHSNGHLSERKGDFNNNTKNSNVLKQLQANWPHSLGRSSNEQDGSEHSVPSLSNGTSSERWSAPVVFDQPYPKRWLGRSGKEKRGVPEDLLFRQASIDVTSLPSTRRHKHDRQRGISYNSNQGGGDRNSRDAVPLFGALPSRIPVMPKSGRPPPSQRTGRSSSASASRYENWPEYMPSTADEASRLGRRHASDMSFGATARKADMLPPELLGKANDSDYPHIDNLPERFGGRGWRRRRFGLGHRDSIEVKFVVRNLLRRRRKGNLDNGESIINQDKDDGQTKWPGGAEKDLRFESELEQDTVFSLLNRICPECGFRITIRRGNFKIKMEVPRGGDLEPLLVSVVLIRISHGRNTLICLSRSKEDASGGPIKDIYSAATLLRNRLESHVEFIEDSFASLYLEGGSATPDTESHLGRNV